MKPYHLLEKHIADQTPKIDSSFSAEKNSSSKRPSMQNEYFRSLEESIRLNEKNKFTNFQTANNFSNNHREAGSSTNTKKRISFTYSSRNSSPSNNIQNKEKLDFITTTHHIRNLHLSAIETPKKPQTPAKIIYQMVRHEDTSPRHSSRTFVQIQNQNLILKQQIKRILELLNQQRNKSLRQSQNQSQILRIQKQNKQLRQFCRVIKQNPANLRGFDEEVKIKQELFQSYQSTIKLKEEINFLKRQNIELRQKLNKYQGIRYQKSQGLVESDYKPLGQTIQDRFRELQNQIKKLRKTQETLKQKLMAEELWKQAVSDQISILERNVEDKEKQFKQIQYL